MYGIQTDEKESKRWSKFENDVKMYGIQTKESREIHSLQFENDVKTYGIQTHSGDRFPAFRLRMM
ncbi:MAG: hypothetical protein EGR88_12245 [Ruminococcus sp. SR1/5]|nr:hypothetical protein [Ruminococcus sp.]